MSQYREIPCSSALNKLKRKFPYSWDLNLYRGCEHGCQYCYAMYSHQYLENKNYFDEIYVKTNILEHLERELSRSDWKRKIINIGGVTDSYQPAESQYQLMPEVLRLLIRYKTPCIISTKSDLILRDYDLIEELASLTYVNVAATITCMEEGIRRPIEPQGAPSSKRFAMLKEFSKTNASTGLHFMPIIPYLTDNRENVEALYSSAQDSRVRYVLPGVLYLRGPTRAHFFQFIQQTYPELAQPLQNLYQTGSAGKDYKNRLYPMVNELKAKYQLSSSYTDPIKEKLKPAEPVQLSFLD